MQTFSQRAALVCGGLCMGVGLMLVLTSHLSSRYILEEQRDHHMTVLMGQLTRQLAPVVAQNDLIRLEATLRTLLEQHDLQMISVTGVDARPLGQAGQMHTPDSSVFRRTLTIDGNVAGELTVAKNRDPVLLEQERMSLALLFLCVLASLFAAVLAGRWAQTISRRLSSLRGRLSVAEDTEVDELTALERAVDALPLELIVPMESGSHPGLEFEEAGLLFIQLNSLTRYVETLDEQSLLDYTDELRNLFESVSALYGGQLSVAREFAVLVLFSGPHGAGAPGFRAACSAWLLGRVADALSSRRPRQFQFAMACGVGEAGRYLGANTPGKSLYADLYNQHIIDDLSAMADGKVGSIRLSKTLAAVGDIRSRCRLDMSSENPRLEAFEEPFADLLERQYQLLIREFVSSR